MFYPKTAVLAAALRYGMLPQDKLKRPGLKLREWISSCSQYALIVIIPAFTNGDQFILQVIQIVLETLIPITKVKGSLGAGK